VEHRERLCRFGFEYVEAALAGRGARIVVMEDGELEDHLVRDVTEVMTSLCARLYGSQAVAPGARGALERIGLDAQPSPVAFDGGCLAAPVLVAAWVEVRARRGAAGGGGAVLSVEQEVLGVRRGQC